MRLHRDSFSISILACSAWLVALAGLAPVAGAGDAAGAATTPEGAKTTPRPAPAFELLKSLAGEWRTTAPDGQTVRAVYKLTASDSCIEETLLMPEGGEMVTMYHMDGPMLMMTHYCAAGNQPRMRCGPIGDDGKTLTFTMFDATNLASKDAPHMNRLVLRVDDASHMSQEWTLHTAEKDTPHAFQFERVKS